MPDNPSQPEVEWAKPLAGKTAVVTGGSTGIGRAIALELACNGADVVIHGRAASDASECVRKEIEAMGQQALGVFADFSQRPSFEDLVDQAWSWHQKINIWINNAGGDVLTGEWPARPLTEKLDFLWHVDVVPTLMLSRMVGQKMIDCQTGKQSDSAGGYCILNMGWDQAWQGMEGESGELFATTKGAIMSMTKSLAKSLAPKVRVNCLAPGWIKTKWGESASDYWSERAVKESLMKRWGTPEDVAKVASFLCSDRAGFVSGQIVPINGGLG